LLQRLSITKPSHVKTCALELTAIFSSPNQIEQDGIDLEQYLFASGKNAESTMPSGEGARGARVIFWFMFLQDVHFASFGLARPLFFKKCFVDSGIQRIRQPISNYMSSLSAPIFFKV
jgi:hypothetical protein